MQTLEIYEYKNKDFTKLFALHYLCKIYFENENTARITTILAIS